MVQVLEKCHIQNLAEYLKFKKSVIRRKIKIIYRWSGVKTLSDERMSLSGHLMSIYILVKCFIFGVKIWIFS